MSKWARLLIAGGVVAAIVAGVLAAYTKGCVPEAPSPVTPGSTSGSIEVPHSGDAVPPVFDVSGRHSALPSGYHVWLATEVNGLLWPKKPEIGTSDRMFSVTISEGGKPADGKLRLVLFQVSSRGDERIDQWFAQHEGTTSFPGIAPSSLDGFARLDVKDLWLR